MKEPIEITASRELFGAVQELRDEVMLSLSRGPAPSTRDLVRLRRVVNELQQSDAGVQFERLFSKWRRWAYEQGVAQIDAMIRGEGVGDVLQLPEPNMDLAGTHVTTEVKTIIPQLHEALSREITLGFAGMRTPNETIARIEAQFNTTRWKAERIAITEIKNMANKAQEVRIRETFAAGRDNGVPLEKIWVHSSGQKVGFRAGSQRAKYTSRPHHKAMHGVGVAEGEMFTLATPTGTYLVDGPHDESLPAGEVVNCHCSRGIRVDREKYKLRNQ